MAELVTGKTGGRPVSVVRGLAAHVLAAGTHGPGARVLNRPRSQDMFALGAREAVVAAVRGGDVDCFGSPATLAEVLEALASCGLEAGAVGDAGDSVRVVLPATEARDQVVAAERVRLLASAVVHLPSERRMAERARSIDRPIASKTCEALTDPTMQAEPLEAQIPSKSSAISIVSDSIPIKLTFSVLVSRRTGSPFCCASGKRFVMFFHN